MSTYEIPALLNVGAIETTVLLSVKNTSNSDNPDSNESWASASILDVD